MSSRKFPRNKARQRGATAVEFGIIAVLFFTLFFGIIEAGRFFYLYNTVQEVTRCAARAAAVTWRDSDRWDDTKSDSIQQQCLFGHDVLVAGWEIHADNILLRALNLAYVKVNNNDPSSVENNISNCSTDPTASNCIRFVEASVWCDSGVYCDTVAKKIRYSPMFGLIPLNINIPNSTVTMPAESLGYGG